VQVPKGFKLKNVVKDLYKEAMLNSGIIHKERRSYLRGELANLGSLLSAVPGLIAPKFPMIITSLSMARAEIEWYFLHLSIAAGAKRTYKHVTAEHYDDPQIVILIGLVYDLIGTIGRNSHLVQQYYAEYLKQTDKAALQSLVQEIHGQVQSFGAGIAQIFAEMIGYLDALRVDNPESADLEVI
jgi:NCK-associated protein 1